MTTPAQEISEQSSQHTPGPWRLDGPSHALVIDEHYHCIDAGSGYYEEDIPQGFEIRGYMSVHDARLIAAAPEMYEALRLLVADVQDYPAWNRPCHAVDVARAAIAKAEGR